MDEDNEHEYDDEYDEEEEDDDDDGRSLAVRSSSSCSSSRSSSSGTFNCGGRATTTTTLDLLVTTWVRSAATWQSLPGRRGLRWEAERLWGTPRPKDATADLPHLSDVTLSRLGWMQLRYEAEAVWGPGAGKVVAGWTRAFVRETEEDVAVLGRGG